MLRRLTSTTTGPFYTVANKAFPEIQLYINLFLFPFRVPFPAFSLLRVHKRSRCKETLKLYQQCTELSELHIYIYMYKKFYYNSRIRDSAASYKYLTDRADFRNEPWHDVEWRQ